MLTIGVGAFPQTFVWRNDISTAQGKKKEIDRERENKKYIIYILYLGITLLKYLLGILLTMNWTFANSNLKKKPNKTHHILL